MFERRFDCAYFSVKGGGSWAPPVTVIRPPGLARPKSSPPPQPKIFSPTPSPAHKSWFSLLASPCPSPVSFAPPPLAFTSSTTATAPQTSVTPQVQPHAYNAATMQPSGRLPNNLMDNTALTNIASATIPPISHEDPWTHAHVRVCAHASDHCAACSITLICCSCQALRYTPGPPPSSPLIPCLSSAVQRSRSASPALFRNVGNGSPPPGFDSCDDHPPLDDDAYSKALAESDTCDNSSCPRGHNEPATYSIVVEQFDEGSEELYDRTFHACSACNRSCKKSFLGYRIKSRTFDNSVREALNIAKAAVPSLPEPVEATTTVHSPPTPLPPPPSESRPVTPLEVFSLVVRQHRISCDHLHSVCPSCSQGVLCCSCKTIHTAPAWLRLHCTHCRHFACASCLTPLLLLLSQAVVSRRLA